MILWVLKGSNFFNVTESNISWYNISYALYQFLYHFNILVWALWVFPNIMKLIFGQFDPRPDSPSLNTDSGIKHFKWCPAPIQTNAGIGRGKKITLYQSYSEYLQYMVKYPLGHMANTAHSPIIHSIMCGCSTDSYQPFAGISNLKSNIFCILSTAVPDSALSIVDDLGFHSSLSLRRCALPRWEQHFAFDLSLDTVFYTGFPIQIWLH